MIRAVIKNKEAWVKAISLDPFTGLDQDGYKIRAAQGVSWGSSFARQLADGLPLYSSTPLPLLCPATVRAYSRPSAFVAELSVAAGIWQKVIENLAVLDYDHNDLSLASYDWRLACVQELCGCPARVLAHPARRIASTTSKSEIATSLASRLR